MKPDVAETKATPKNTCPNEDTDEFGASESGDVVVVMEPKSIMHVRVHVRSVTKAEPLIVVPPDF